MNISKNYISKELSRIGMALDGPCLSWCFTHNRTTLLSFIKTNIITDYLL
jgi:hypothetical protein